MTYMYEFFNLCEAVENITGITYLESTIALNGIVKYIFYFVISKEAYDDIKGYTYIFKTQLCLPLLLVSVCLHEMDSPGQQLVYCKMSFTKWMGNHMDKHFALKNKCTKKINTYVLFGSKCFMKYNLNEL